MPYRSIVHKRYVICAQWANLASDVFRDAKRLLLQRACVQGKGARSTITVDRVQVAAFETNCRTLLELAGIVCRSLAPFALLGRPNRVYYLLC